MNSELAIKYNRIYDNVKMRDVISMYSARVEKDAGRCMCPIHNGRDLNFSYNSLKYHCFVCGAKGNVISFVAQLYGMSNIEAAHKISEDFNLNVFDSNSKIRKSELRYIRKRKQDEDKKTAYYKGLEEEYIKLTNVYHKINAYIKKNAPKTENDFNDVFVEAVHFRTLLEYQIEQIYQEITQC